MLIQYFRLYRMWLELLEFCFFSFLIIQFVRLVLADADLTLLWKEKFGKKPGMQYVRYICSIDHAIINACAIILI